MNNPFFRQAEQFLKPISEMAALNARTFEALAQQQASFMSSVWSDGVNCATDLADKRDVSSLYASQRDFWEGVNEKFSSTARDSYNVLTEAHHEMGQLMQSSLSSVDVSAAAEPFMRSAYQAQEAAQGTAEEAVARTRRAAQEASAQTGQASAQSRQASETRKAAEDVASRAQQTNEDAVAKAHQANQEAASKSATSATGSGKPAAKAAQKGQSQAAKATQKNA